MYEIFHERFEMFAFAFVIHDTNLRFDTISLVFTTPTTIF
jgi:hypothetical protein